MGVRRGNWEVPEDEMRVFAYLRPEPKHCFVLGSAGGALEVGVNDDGHGRLAVAAQMIVLCHFNGRISRRLIEVSVGDD